MSVWCTKFSVHFCVTHLCRFVARTLLLCYQPLQVVSKTRVALLHWVFNNLAGKAQEVLAHVAAFVLFACQGLWYTLVHQRNFRHTAPVSMRKVNNNYRCLN